jgi:D-glycero-alpha-D-manno-heptose-7-phosphate kinase
MIISQTPYRVSFAGGGTDLPAYYRHEFGAVLSMTIRKYMYVTVGRRFEKSIRVAYTRTDFADTVAEVQHTLVREALRTTGLVNHLEITTIGDVPAGTGMGSSSTLTVGLLNAMYAHSGRIVGPKRLAEEACRIEIDVLGKPIGKQDQYAAAYGGLNYIRFNPDGSVEVEPTPVRSDTFEELERRLLLVYTAQTRSADDILKKQSEGTADKLSVLRRMRDLAQEMRVVLAEDGDVDAFGGLLHEGWELKRSLGFGISGEQVDAWYEAARRAGAQGGKLLGAGGGGFLLLMAPRERHDTIREALGRPKEIDCRFDRRGSRIVFISDQQ